MAITSAVCNSFKQEILQGYHSFNASGDTPAAMPLNLLFIQVRQLLINLQQLTQQQMKFLIRLDLLIQQGESL